MKTSFIMVVFQVALFNHIYTQSAESAFTIYHDETRISADKFENETIPVKIDVHRHDSIFLSIEFTRTAEDDSIIITLTETEYYPERITCLLNDQIQDGNKMSVTNSRFNEYILDSDTENDEKYVFKITFKYRKKWKMIDLLIVTVLRHLGSDYEIIELVEM